MSGSTQVDTSKIKVPKERLDEWVADYLNNYFVSTAEATKRGRIELREIIAVERQEERGKKEQEPDKPTTKRISRKRANANAVCAATQANTEPADKPKVAAEGKAAAKGKSVADIDKEAEQARFVQQLTAAATGRIGIGLRRYMQKPGAAVAVASTTTTAAAASTSSTPTEADAPTTAAEAAASTTTAAGGTVAETEIALASERQLGAARSREDRILSRHPAPPVAKLTLQPEPKSEETQYKRHFFRSLSLGCSPVLKPSVPSASQAMMVTLQRARLVAQKRLPTRAI